jgi:hypothetical protein
VSKRILNRREFLSSAGKVAASVIVLSGTTTILADNQAWAMDLKVLDQNEAAVLLKMARQLYPHRMLGDVYYAEVVEALDAKIASDPAQIQLVRDGVAELDKVMGVPFLKLSDEYQLEALKRIETTPFFQTVRGHEVVALYNNKNVWADMGYQGSSYQDGGYLYRGFQDAGWTMQPDAEASPPAYTG